MFLTTVFGATTTHAASLNWPTAGETQPSWAEVIGLTDAVAKYPKINGAGVTFAVMDSGIDFTQPWYKAAGRNVSAYDFSTGATEPGTLSTSLNDDLLGHGSGVTAFIWANGAQNASGQGFTGIAPAANLVFLRINVNNGATFQNALNWLLNHRNGVSVLNASFGYGNGYNTAVALEKAGVFMATAGGNSSNYIAANTPFTVAAGANLAGTAIGTDGVGISAGGPGITAIAPAVGLWIGYPGPVNPQSASFGTSWASPQLAAIGVLLRQVAPTITNAQINTIIKTSSSRSVNDSRFGVSYPLINVVAALDQVCAQFPNPALCSSPSSSPQSPAPQPAPSPQPAPAPLPASDYLSCTFASPATSWIRQSVIAGGAAEFEKLGCPTGPEVVPAGYSNDGRYTYQVFSNSGLCVAWNWAKPNNYVATNFIVQPCAGVKGYNGTGASAPPPASVQQCSLYASTLTDLNQWIAQSYMQNADANFAKIGCPTSAEIVAKPADGRYTYQKFEKGCMAWDWTRPNNYVATNYIAKTTGCP